MTGQDLVRDFQGKGSVTIGFGPWHYLGFSAALYFGIACLIGAAMSWFSFETIFMLLLGVGFGAWSIRGLLKPRNPANKLVIDGYGLHYRGETFPWNEITGFRAVHPLRHNWGFYELEVSGRRLGTSMHNIPGKDLAEALNWLRQRMTPAG